MVFEPIGCPSRVIFARFPFRGKCNNTSNIEGRHRMGAVTKVYVYIHCTIYHIVYTIDTIYIYYRFYIYYRNWIYYILHATYRFMWSFESRDCPSKIRPLQSRSQVGRAGVLRQPGLPSLGTLRAPLKGVGPYKAYLGLYWQYFGLWVCHFGCLKGASNSVQVLSYGI